MQMGITENKKIRTILWAVGLAILAILVGLAIWQPAFYNFLRSKRKREEEDGYDCWLNASALGGSVSGGFDDDIWGDVPSWGTIDNENENGGDTGNTGTNGSGNENDNDPIVIISDPQSGGYSGSNCSTPAPASFNASFGRTMDIEGGYQAKISDRGNWTGCKKNKGTLAGTKYGISACYLSELYGRPVTKEEIMNLTYSEAQSIYKSNFWDKLIRGDEILNQALADIIFDSTVHKPQWTIKALQETINAIGYAPMLWIDNIIGNKTLEAINFYAIANPAKLYVAFREKRRKYYMGLSNEYPEFINGWIARIDDFNDY